MKPICTILISLLWLLWADPTRALYMDESKIIDVAAIPSALEADPYAHFLEDADRTLTIDDFISGNAAPKLQDLNGGALNRGYSHSAVWIRLRLTIGEGHQRSKLEKVLQISYPLLDEISVYQVVDGKVSKHWNTGDTLPFSQRPIDHNSFLFPLFIEKHKNTEVYLRVVSSSSLRIPLTLWDPIHFYQTQKSILLIDGLYYGILFLMFFYNLCLFLTVRDLTYLYYILYIVAMVAFQSAMNGYGFEFVWPDTPAINKYTVGLSICTIAAFMTLFARKVLETKERLPRFDILLKVLIAIQPALIAMCFILPYSIAIKPVIINSLFSSMLMIILGITLATYNRTAKLFLVAWITMLVGAMLLAAASLGWVQANILTTNAFVLGSAIEVTLLSFTLAERMRAIQKKQTETEKNAKLMLQKANEALIDSNQLKDEFLATISHELRTPMNGVIGCLENIRGEIQDSALNAYIHSADRSAQQMMMLIDGILTYTEIHSHGLRLDNSPFEITKLSPFIKELYLDSAQSKGLELQFIIDPELPKLIIGDKRQTFQIISNLVDNAIKFTPKGFVKIQIEATDFNAAQSTVALNISVIDSGIGINEEKAHLIFEKFRQADGSFHRNYGGLGIGLAISKDLADLMGATITYTPTGSGSQFSLSITLPYIKANPAPKQGTHPPSTTTDDQRDNQADGHGSPPQIPEGLTAIVVEDNPVNQMVLKGILKKLNFEVLTAENGQVAVETLQNHLVDVILMDCQMPVMDGFNATRHIRQLDNANANAPIIAVTANAMAKDREHCIDAGMDDYLSKPVKSHQISQKLAKWLHRSSAA